ncbi:ABC transporter ATP-binding protein [Streptomyces sp. NPDC001843]|uniref:ABC transporter ATP-binding protein n=1 Tax=Streptomyces sp. NPDC001843 TaxID=3364617 RepID=UPI0036B0E5A8
MSSTAPSGCPDHAVAAGGHRRFVRVAWRAGPGLVLTAAASLVVSALGPLMTVVAVGAVVGEAPGVATHGLDSQAGLAALWWSAATSGLLTLQWMVAALRNAATTALGERVDAVLQRDLMRAVMAPDGIGHLEDPRCGDLISVGRETFRGSWGRPGRLASTVGGLVTARATLLGACVIVAGFHLVLGSALLVVALWAAREEKVASRAEAAHHYGDSETSRRLEYYYELGADPAAAKEIRIFGLAGFLTERFTVTWRRSMIRVITPLPLRPVVANVALAMVVIGGLVWIAVEARGGAVPPAHAVVWAQALMVGLGAMQQASWTGLQTELAMATLRRFDEAVAVVSGAGSVPTAVSSTPSGVSVGSPPPGDIRFENVSFSYPGVGAKALIGLDLEIPVGRSLAIVGANGAGKTTLVKLLCRLHEPTAGRITIGGADLAALDTAAWRRRIAAVFQNATHFALSARTNVSFGRPDADPAPAAVEAAAVRAGIAEEIARLPQGWDTPLSAGYSDGVDLSGGQWQRLALARALFAVDNGADVLIMDEPAAHLDARSEARLHEEFMDLTRGLTTVVISHRFSTVRRAHSIAVIDRGRIVEQGTHDELMASNGRYAEMFRLQASRFADGPRHEPARQPVPYASGAGHEEKDVQA